MTRAATILQLLTATPGMNVREVHAALGEGHAYNAVAAHMSTMAKAGKLRRDATAVRGGRYWITELASKDRRLKENRPATAPKARKAKPAANRDAPRETRAVMRARISAECDRSRTKRAEVPRIIAPRRTAATVTSAQTVEEFQRAGGVIQKLHSHASSNPLRFDHSDYSQHRRGRIQRRREGAL